ncbi:MAG: sigma-54 dependent transcriptional regulator [Succinivibrionaceae bacterium]|nr:sigma-54 dependent transcriptional regulator [Succinivibrionaceae bacterium]
MDTFVPKVLMVEDSAPIRAVYSAYLKNEQINLKMAATGEKALDLINSFKPHIILLDIYLPDMSGIDILKMIFSSKLDIKVIVVTGSDSVTDAVDAMHYGAYDFMSKPISAQRLKVTLNNTINTLHLNNLVTQYQSHQSDQFVGFIGASKVMQGIYQTIERVAPSKASVFITGESGTGKEVCAEAIHKLSSCKNGRFIPLNCAAIPKDLMESEIFGHVKGAFTGALTTREGAVGLADGGTLFLDEICEMDLSLQSKLLRFLQTGKYYKVGSNELESVDVRIVCATNRNPMVEVKAGRFREDLYYRLHVIPIALPPLRERGDDVERIAQKFLIEFSKEEKKSFSRFSLRASQLLMSYDWPGNVRQLQNVVRQIVVMNDGAEVTEEMLPDTIRSFVNKEYDVPSGVLGSVPRPYDLQNVERGFTVKPLAQVERETIEKTINFFHGNIERAAQALEINSSTIYRKMKVWSRLDKETD